MMDEVDNGILHQGWITKSPPLECQQQNVIFKARWRRRWFTLQQGKLPDEFLLNYYSDETKRKLKGTISLNDVEQVDSGLSAENGKHKYEFMFDIKTPTRTYYLAVDTREEMKAWVDYICSTCGLQSTKDDDDASPPKGRGPDTSAVYSAVAEVDPTPSTGSQEQIPAPAPPSISSPYVPLSECFSGTVPGKTPPPKPERTAVVKHQPSKKTQPAPTGLVVLPLHSDPLPPVPLHTEAPSRPPKPPHLAALPPPPSQNEGHASTSGQERPTQPGHNPQNYANSKEMQELCLNEQNNNSGQRGQQGKQSSTEVISRNHKPSRNSHFMQPGMSQTLQATANPQPAMSATLGPPVKRDLKPKSPGFNTGSSGNGPGFHSLGRVGVSSGSSSSKSGHQRTNRSRHRSHRHNQTSSSNTNNHSDHEGSNSDHSESGIVANFPPSQPPPGGPNRRDSGSEEQIYFYMPPANTTSGGQLMIPADSFEHPSLSYIDLDLGGSPSSKPPPKSKKVPEKETIYKTVDFEKTEAFNRTKQVVESRSAALNASFVVDS